MKALIKSIEIAANMFTLSIFFAEVYHLYFFPTIMVEKSPLLQLSCFLKGYKLLSLSKRFNLICSRI